MGMELGSQIANQGFRQPRLQLRGVKLTLSRLIMHAVELRRNNDKPIDQESDLRVLSEIVAQACGKRPIPPGTQPVERGFQRKLSDRQEYAEGYVHRKSVNPCASLNRKTAREPQCQRRKHSP